MKSTHSTTLRAPTQPRGNARLTSNSNQVTDVLMFESRDRCRGLKMMPFKMAVAMEYEWNMNGIWMEYEWLINGSFTMGYQPLWQLYGWYVQSGIVVRHHPINQRWFEAAIPVRAVAWSPRVDFVIRSHQSLLLVTTSTSSVLQVHWLSLVCCFFLLEFTHLSGLMVSEPDVRQTWSPDHHTQKAEKPPHEPLCDRKVWNGLQWDGQIWKAT